MSDPLATLRTALEKARGAFTEADRDAAWSAVSAALEGVEREHVWTEPNDGTTYTAHRLAELLHERDAFIVEKGLFGEFVDEWLPRRALQGTPHAD